MLYDPYSGIIQWFIIIWCLRPPRSVRLVVLFSIPLGGPFPVLLFWPAALSAPEAWCANPGVPNQVPGRALSMQVFIPTNHYNYC